VIQRVDATAPHEVLLVLDANQGQNAMSQAVQFHLLGSPDSCSPSLMARPRAACARHRPQVETADSIHRIGEQVGDFGEFNAEAFAAALVEGSRERGRS